MKIAIPLAAAAAVAAFALTACGKPAGVDPNDPAVAETSKAMPGAEAAASAQPATPPAAGEDMPQTPPIDTPPRDDMPPAAPPPTETVPPQ